MDTRQWYYFDEKGQRQGPVASDTLGSLVAQKLITRETVIVPASENIQTAKDIIGSAPVDHFKPQENLISAKSAPPPPSRPVVPTSAKGGEILVRMQCGVCKSLLACDFERRRKPMVCPLCERLAPLVYLPPGGAGDKPVHELPVAKYPSSSRIRRLKQLSPVLWFVLGFLACVAVYALDFGHPVDRVARKIVNAVQEEFGATKTDARDPVAHPVARPTAKNSRPSPRPPQDLSNPF